LGERSEGEAGTKMLEESRRAILNAVEIYDNSGNTYWAGEARTSLAKTERLLAARAKKSAT
jgi:hypothetical protein